MGLTIVFALAIAIGAAAASYAILGPPPKWLKKVFRGSQK